MYMQANMFLQSAITMNYVKINEKFRYLWEKNSTLHLQSS